MKKLIKVLPIVFFAISTVPTVTMEDDDVMPIPGWGDIMPPGEEEIIEEEEEQQLSSPEAKSSVKDVLARVTLSKNQKNNKKMRIIKRIKIKNILKK